MRRSLKATEAGITKARQALKLKGWSQEFLSGRVDCSRQTIVKFFKPDYVDDHLFKEICAQLGLKWEEITELEVPDERKAEPAIEYLIEEVRSHCCHRLQSLYSKIRLLNLKQIDVDQLYVDVYLLGRLSSTIYATIADLTRHLDGDRHFDRLGLGQRGDRLPGMEIAKQCDRLMVLGKPGSGKTTFLRHLAIACCKKKFRSDYIPVLIELRSIQNVIQFELSQTIQDELGLDHRLTQEIFKTGKVLLLLDGLDEVPTPSRRVVQNKIFEFSKKHYNISIILTCRTQTAEYSLNGFEYVEVADFNPEQVRRFVHNWFIAFSAREASLAAKLVTQLEQPEHCQMAELTTTPILLSLICWVFQDTQGNLPVQRGDLYQRGLDLLLEQWDVDRNINRTIGGEVYQALSIEQKQVLLSDIAVRKFKQQQFILFEQHEIQRYIANHLGISSKDSLDVLRAIEAQHGLLIERASKIYSFSHLTFQEFFVAKGFDNLAISQRLVGYITDPRWREVFRLRLEQSTHVDSLLFLMKRQVDTLLAKDVKLQNFLSWINQKSKSANSSYKPSAVRAFYFARVLVCTMVCAIVYALNLDLDSTHTRPLDSTLNLALDLAHTLDLATNLDLALAIEPALGHSLELAKDSKLHRQLQEVKEKLPDGSWKNREMFKRWWTATGKAWTSQLRSIIFEERNVKDEWQFSEAQKQLLQQYYDANKFLVECSKFGSPKAKAEIERVLLLPIVEIEERDRVTGW